MFNYGKSARVGYIVAIKLNVYEGLQFSIDEKRFARPIACTSRTDGFIASG